MAHRSRHGSGNALQRINGCHHHRDGAIARARLNHAADQQPVGSLPRMQAQPTFQHHMTAGTFPRVEPKIASSGLTQADPFILAVVAAH